MTGPLPVARALDSADLQQTAAAFDSVAADYDGPRGNNLLIRRMRDTVWRELEARFAPGAALLDLGCGTGLDAVHLAQRGHRVVATDWSMRMVERTAARAAAAGVASQVDARRVGAHELQTLGSEFDARFAGAYSNFGPLNCVPDLREHAAQCARLVRPGGHLVFTVIGRLCPWEYLHYRWRRPERARIRGTRGPVAVGMNGHTIWTTYYWPREFHAAFVEHFELVEYRALGLFLPPPYLLDRIERHPRLFELLGRLDDMTGAWPALRNAGDHFLIVMRRR